MIKSNPKQLESHLFCDGGDEWETPDDLFGVLHDEFLFTFDAAAQEHNTKCYFYSNDSLNDDWGGSLRATVWLNPPYSRGNIDKFMRKAYHESLNGCTVVALVRFDPSTTWFKEYVDGRADEVRMLARRVKFIGAKSAYNFPCCIVVYRPNTDNAPKQTTYYIWDWK